MSITSMEPALCNGPLATIDGALRDHLAEVTSTGLRSWCLRIDHALLSDGEARCEPHWLMVEAPIASATPRTGADLLKLHDTAPAGVKLIMDRASRSLVLRGELPLDGVEESQLHSRIGAICGAINETASRFATASPESRLVRAPHGASDPSSDPAHLAALCADCGWPCEPRRNGTRFAARLEVSRASFVANIEKRGDGGLVGWVDLISDSNEEILLESGEATARPIDPSCQAALGVLLGSLAQRVHLVRGAMNTDSTGIRLEAAIPFAGVASDLAHLLSALSVACEQFGPEAQLLLGDVEIAKAFLARGWSAG